MSYENDAILDEIAFYIGEHLSKYYRVSVTQCKVKWSEPRVYCSLGWSDVADIIQPGWMYFKFDNPLYRKLCCIRFPGWVFNLTYTIHAKLYRRRYKQAIRKWPEFKEVIICGADHTDELRGL